MSKNDTSRDEMFAAIYVGEGQFDGTRTLELMGQEAKNRNSLNSIASHMLAKPLVKSLIKQNVEEKKITQQQVLDEMAKMAFWDHEANRPTGDFGMEEAKLYDTDLRAKGQSLAALLKATSIDVNADMARLRNAILQHKADFPETTDEERYEMFSPNVTNKQLLKQVLEELSKAATSDE